MILTRLYIIESFKAIPIPVKILPIKQIVVINSYCKFSSKKSIIKFPALILKTANIIIFFLLKFANYLFVNTMHTIIAINVYIDKINPVISMDILLMFNAYKGKNAGAIY